MCEIILVIILARKVAGIAKDKGRRAAPWVVLFIAMWIGGEISGAVLGALFAEGVARGAREPDYFVVWIFALGGAALGAVSAFAIVKCLPSHSDRYLREGRYAREDDYDDPDPGWRDRPDDREPRW